MRQIRAPRPWGLALVCVLGACEEKKRSAPLLDQTVEVTLVSANDGGPATNAVMIGETAAFPLPAGDVPAPDHKPEMRAPGVYVVTLRDGRVRPVYLGLGSLFFGPPLPADAAAGDAITFVGGASTAWSDPALRETVIQVTRERELGELPAVLAAVADRLDGPVWPATVRSLATDERAALARELEPALHEAEARNRLLAATLVLDLDASPQAVAARLASLGDDPPAPDRLAASLLLRALARVRPDDAAALACRVVASPTRSGDPWLGAALLALRGSSTEPACLAPTRALLERNACDTDVRCARLPSSPGDEPLCTREEAQQAARDEAARSPWSLLERPQMPTTLLALHVAHEARSVPAAFLTAQARRRFAIQATGPACAEAGPKGASCTPDEAEIRQAACRATMPKAHTDNATFLVDARAKKLREIRRSVRER